MKRAEYDALRDELAWTHAKLARVVGVDYRTAFRYAAHGKIPEPTARLLRALVWARLTLSRRKFDELVNQLED